MSREHYIEQIVQSFVAFRKGLVKVDAKDLHSLSHAQTDAMMCIAENQPVAVSELARLLRVTPGAATQLTDALIKSDFIERKIDENDRRVTKIQISVNGSKALASAKEEKMRRLHGVLSPLSDEELETLAKLLAKVSKSVHKH